MHYITWNPHGDSAKSRLRAPYATLAEAKAQAQYDHDVNNRVDVRVEDTKGKILWKPKEN